jgi:hypothetical protein
MKTQFSYKEYKKILENDLASLTEMCMGAKEYDSMVEYFLDEKCLRDEEFIPEIKKAYMEALSEGDFPKAFQINAFLGYVKKKLKRRTK